MRDLITKGKPMPKSMSNTLEPIAFETAMSPKPSRATMIELSASWKIIDCLIKYYLQVVLFSHARRPSF